MTGLPGRICFARCPYAIVQRRARVAELADARDLKSRGREAVGVRFPPRAPAYSSVALVRCGGIEPASGAERSARTSPTLGGRQPEAAPHEADGVIAEAEAVDSPPGHQGKSRACATICRPFSFPQVLRLCNFGVIVSGDPRHAFLLATQRRTARISDCQWYPFGVFGSKTWSAMAASKNPRACS